MTKALWKIGELAEKTGLTVRALHHYEEIGLLVPSHRGENNYRLYTPADIERLQQIVSLKELGFPLEKIKETLEAKSMSALDILQMQMSILQTQFAKQKKLLEYLDGLVRMLQSRKNPTTEDLLMAISLSHNVGKYYTDEQKAYIEERAKIVGDKAIREAEQEWPKLIAAMQSCMDNGTDPADPTVRKLAKRWRELVDAFTGGNKEIEASLKTMYQEEPAARHFGPDVKMMEYVDEAMKHLAH
jgi:MerR family transcriptional regulator, thiopeptide resistance regulator